MRFVRYAPLWATLILGSGAVAEGGAALAQASSPAPVLPDSDPVTGTPYKADYDMKEVLLALAQLTGGKTVESLSVADARRLPTMTDAVKAVLAARGEAVPATKNSVPGISSEDRTIPGPAGPLPVRVYTPHGTGPFPVIVYFHGGGWVLADKQVYDGGARGLAKSTQAVVVSVDYRLAPEAKFPAAWDDALAAYRWVAANAESLKGNPHNLALAGESAGGNLAVSTAVAAIATGAQLPRAVLAVYPVAQTGNLATDSYVDCATAKPLNKAMIGWFMEQLLASPADKDDPRLDIVHANLRGLPPVTIIGAQIDPLRTDGVLLEMALKNAGVTVTRKEYGGVTHEFFGAAAVVAKAKDAQKFAGEELRRSIAH